MRYRPVSTLAIVALALSATPALAAPVTLTAALSGAAEPKGGDPDGSGGFTVELDPETNDFCYALWTEKTAKPTAAHVHSGAAGADGPVVVTLEVTGKGNDMCIAVDKDKLDPIAAKPEDFYVNVHTADFGSGAVRGQLAKK